MIWAAAAILLVTMRCGNCYGQQKHLEGYDRFGPYSLGLLEDHRAVYAGLRTFIWSHWHERRTGYATLTTTSTEEFATCTRDYIIGPDAHGRWYVNEELRCGAGGGGGPKQTTEWTRWYSVQRVAKGGEEKEPPRPLPDSANVRADSYTLILTDRSGRRTAEL